MSSAQSRRHPHVQARVRTIARHRHKNSKTSQMRKVGPAAAKQLTFLNRALDPLEEKLGQITAKIAAKADAATLQVDLGLAELEDGFRDTLKWVTNKTTPVRRFKMMAMRTVERLKIRLHLAKMDSNDTLHNAQTRLWRMQSQIARLQKDVGADASHILRRVEASCKQIYGQVSALL